MVKLGFIGEGATEKAILESPKFKILLDKLELDYVVDVIDAGGNTSLLPDKISAYIEILQDKGATQIIILTDMDDAPCITKAKEYLKISDEHIVIIAVKVIEAWFLADTEAISARFNEEYFCEFPEEVGNFAFIKNESIRLTKRGFRRKIILCKKMLASGFTIQNAAQHPNCPSAAYFIRRLKEL